MLRYTIPRQLTSNWNYSRSKFVLNLVIIKGNVSKNKGVEINEDIKMFI